MKRVQRIVLCLIVCATTLCVSTSEVVASSSRTQKGVVRGGMLLPSEAEVIEGAEGAEISETSESSGTSGTEVSEGAIVEAAPSIDSTALRETLLSDTLSGAEPRRAVPMINAARANPDVITRDTLKRRFLSDSVSLSKMCWTAAVLPGYGQIYNKQYWKLPIIYGSLAAGIALYINENKRYKPLKAEYEEIVAADLSRTEYLNELQGQMIRSNTRRQLYLGATIASYIYSLGDAAVNYATNDVSGVKRATTLATICPGAGQIYNKQYWKVPFVVGGFAAMIYVVDWNNRGYQRFKTAYNQIIAYESNPDAYPDGSPDEFGGRYTSDYMQSLRDSYRRNRDLSIIFLAGLYALQIIDAHVDAHFKEYDISDDLSMNIEPLVSYNYSPTQQRDGAVFGFNVGFKV